MRLSELKSKILSRMDEVVSSVGGSIPDHYSIEDFIDEGLKELLSLAPAYLLPTSSITSTPHANADGSGYVELPSDCHRLDCFKMTGWTRQAEIIDSNNPLYSVQSNRFMRGNPEYPVAVVCGMPFSLPRLEYYSLPQGVTHTIEKSLYVRRIESDELETLDEKLADALAWVTASLILNVGGETNAGQYAYNRFTENITLVQYTTNAHKPQQNGQDKN